MSELAEPDARFEALAAREPYFAVLTDPRFLRANLTPEHEREFFASGDAIVSWMLAVIDAGLSPQFAPMSVLEYGCGPGRLALPLARRPSSVTAVDRSPAPRARLRRLARHLVRASRIGSGDSAVRGRSRVMLGFCRDGQ